MAAEPDGGTPALTKVRDFLISTCGSVLKAWLAHFDVDLDYRVSKIEFADGMRNLGYTAGELHKLFAEIDADGSGEIVLDELDEEQAMLWNTFRSWAVQNFVSVEDMMLSLTEDESTMNPSTKDLECISQESFCKRLPELNWKAGQEELLFSVLDFDEDGLLRPSCFRWLGIELKRLQRKRAAKASAVKKKPSGSQQNALEQELHEFKEDLRRRFGGGNLTRAWRLSLSDTSVLPRTRFLKACAKMGYAKKGKDLWKMMDKTGSGFASVDEIDPRTAQVVAHFKKFLDESFEDYHAAFEELDLDGTRKIRLRQFQQGLQKLGFPFHTQASTLFAVLDLDCNHVIDEDDLHFLEKWSPLPFLTATPNLNAKDGVKKLLLHRYHRPVKVWRQLLDRDGSNRCNWHEFLFACKTCGFHGDIPGAWRALDADLTGYITLKELDEDSYNTLMEFRTWALDEFGSAKGAFAVFDRDGSNTLTFQEFRAACKIYGYEGHAKRLFSALDVTAEGTLSLKEVAFLDDWREDPEAVKKARNAIAGFLLSPISPRSEAARRGGMVAGFQSVKEMQRKLLDMERAKEAAMQWHSPVAKPMELVDLCRKHALPSEDAASSPSPPPPSPRWKVKGAIPRLEGPDFCRQFFVRQAEVRSQEVRLPDRRVLYSKATGKVPTHLPAIGAPKPPQDARKGAPEAQQIHEEPKQTQELPEEEEVEVVEKMEHLPQPLLKPTLDELLRTPRSFSGLLSSMPWQGKCVKPVGKADKLRSSLA
ncbi:ALMT9 [Symbiodinium sp. CCMP2456]|nr:ALMT9 [Symbiodinium sp. CCMP2456]